MPTAKISNPDVTRLINSTEIQSIVRPAGQKVQKRPWTQKKNPLRNKAVLFRLNPYAKTLRRQELRECEIHFFAVVLFILFSSQTGTSQEQTCEEDQDCCCWRGLPFHSSRSLSYREALVLRNHDSCNTCLCAIYHVAYENMVKLMHAELKHWVPSFKLFF